MHFQNKLQTRYLFRNGVFFLSPVRSSELLLKNPESGGFCSMIDTVNCMSHFRL